MSFKKISEEALNEWVDSLIEKQKVIGVQVKNDRFAFAPLRASADLRLDYDVTVLPPKTFFQPQREALLQYKVGSGYESVFENDPFVLFGVHPYDMAAILQMDDIFSEGNVDLHYVTRREKACTVVADVQSVSANVFAGYMGTSHVEQGYDVLLTKVGDEYLVDAPTAQGEALLISLNGAPDAGASWLDQRKLVWDYNRQRLRKHELKADPSMWPELLENGYEHPVWEDKAQLCFSCGSCNLVCPTCYCFDVRDQLNWDLTSGNRVRVWDGCMLADFATVSGNLNFRKEPAARYRHRYYRKGLYVPGKIGGQIACIGCGRCITACVANIANPIEVFNRLAEDA
jgi:ferredoxin